MYFRLRGWIRYSVGLGDVKEIGAHTLKHCLCQGQFVTTMPQSAGISTTLVCTVPPNTALAPVRTYTVNKKGICSFLKLKMVPCHRGDGFLARSIPS